LDRFHGCAFVECENGTATSCCRTD